MAHFLGIDLGASALKACLVTADGTAMAEARAGFATQTPHRGHSEQNPADWCAALHSALQDLQHAHPEAWQTVKAVSFSGGAHIAVLCDAAGQALRPAIMWNDVRAEAEAARLRQDKTVFARTGNHPNPTWTLPQLMWLAAHEPETVEATRKLYFAKDWLAAQMTQANAGGDMRGRHVTDKSEAVGSLMADKSGMWDTKLTGLSGLPETALPEIVPFGTAIGTLTQAAAEHYGLPRVPVYQGAIDTSMEWLCAAPLKGVTGSLKLASAGVISIGGQKLEPLPPISFYPHILDGLSYHAAGMSDCMGALAHMRQEWTPGLSQAAFEHAAAACTAGAEGVLFHPYLSGARAPFWDATLTASVSGLTRAHGQNALARAAFEGVGHVLTAIWRDMQAKLPRMPAQLHILGGGGSSDFFCQMLADMLNVPILRGRQTDCAFATAIFAAATHQGQKPEDMAMAAYAPHGKFIPDKAAHAVYGLSHQAFMARHKDRRAKP